jgi:DNA mismatch endonuclease (patch repair protein)
MPDVFTKSKRSIVMAAIRSKGNKDTELKLAAIFRKFGITGWRRHYKVLGRPDFVFLRNRVAIFVDGCFWHGCPKHGRRPESNMSYWGPKLERNRKRDRKISKLLRSSGWRVLRIWEHRLSKPAKVALRVRSTLRQKRLSPK